MSASLTRAGGGSGSYPSRAPKSANVYGDASVADMLLADDALWHMPILGDSRFNGASAALIANAPSGIPIGGISLADFSSANSVTGVNAALVTTAGDQKIASPYIGSPWTGSATAFELQTTANTTPWNNTLSNRCSYETLDFATITPLLNRLKGVDSKISCIIRTDSSGLPTYPGLIAGDALVVGLQYIITTAGSTVWTGIGAANNNVGTVFTATATSFTGTGSCSTVAGFQLQFRPNGTTVPTATDYQVSTFIPSYSASVQYQKHSLDIPASTNWTTDTQPDIGIVVSANTALLAGQKLGVHDIWIERGTGIVIHNGASVSGRSLAGALTPTTYPNEMHSIINPMYGDNLVVAIALGTNGFPFGGADTPVMNPTYLAKQTVSDLKTLIDRIRAGKPNAPILLINDYPAQNDATGVAAGTSNLYWQAMITVAQQIPRVLCLDTYNVMPTYTAGAALGYYADATHYNATGKAAWFSAMWNLLLAA